MSDPIRIGLVVEGETDRVAVQAAIRALTKGHLVEFNLLQPEYSAAFNMAGQTGEGWTGVYRWCHVVRLEGNGNASASALFESYDIVVIHLDADVAGETYQRGNIVDDTGDLPCERPCPLARDSVDALRQVLLRWLGERVLPPKCVACIPSKKIETWVLKALQPENKVANRGDWECFATPERQLSSQPLATRVKKRVEDYRKVADIITANWTTVSLLGEAARFSLEFRATAGI